MRHKINNIKIMKKLWYKILETLEALDEFVFGIPFSVEYYPLTGRYYPKYKGYYLRTNYDTGIIVKTKDYLFHLAEYGKTGQEAKEIIELFKEQSLKNNVKTIPVNDV